LRDGSDLEVEETAEGIVLSLSGTGLP